MTTLDHAPGCVCELCFVDLDIVDRDTLILRGELEDDQRLAWLAGVATQVVHDQTAYVLMHDLQRAGQLRDEIDSLLTRDLLAQRGQLTDDLGILPRVEEFEQTLLDTTAIQKLPAPQWLIDGYLVRDSLALLYGPSGACKTFLGLDWALHVATGSWWNDHAVGVAGYSRVFYVIAEGAGGVGRRIEAWTEHHRLYSLDSFAPITWRPLAVNLADANEVAAMAAAVKARQPALVVIDTLARCSLGADENSARDMGMVVANLDHIRQQAGSCVLVLHHTGKDGSAGARGSSALRAAMDTELEVTAVDHRLTLRVTKQKDADEARPLRLDRVTVGESCVLLPAGQVPESDDIGAGPLATLDALRAVQVPGGVSATTWQEGAECSRRSFFAHRAELVKRELVANVGTDARPRYVVSESASGETPDEEF